MIRVWYVHGGGGHPLGGKPEYLRNYSDTHQDKDGLYSSFQGYGVSCAWMPHTTYYDDCLRAQLNVLIRGVAELPPAPTNDTKVTSADDGLLNGSSSSSVTPFAALQAHVEADAARAAIGFDIAVGSSFGSALIIDLMHRGIWTGPALLLCPAVLPGLDPLNLAIPQSSQRVLCVRGTQDDVVRAEVVTALIDANPAPRDGSPGFHLDFLSLEDEGHDLRGLIDPASAAGSGDSSVPSLHDLILRVLRGVENDVDSVDKLPRPSPFVNKELAQRVLASLPAKKGETTKAAAASTNTDEGGGSCCLIL